MHACMHSRTLTISMKTNIRITVLLDVLSQNTVCVCVCMYVYLMRIGLTNGVVASAQINLENHESNFHLIKQSLI